MDEPQISRIIVESESGWLRIKENVTNSLKTSMEGRFSTLPGGRNGEMATRLRSEVEERISKISDEMFRMTNPNLRVNGHNYEEFISATEPFDEPLDRKIKGLISERVGWELTIIGRRKKSPGDIHRLEEDLIQRREVAEWLPDENEGVLGEAAAGPKAQDIPPPPRHAETVETFNQVVSNISQLSAAAPVQVARAARAYTVMEDVGGMMT